ncbi:hypothetical protein LLE96_10010, partial [Bifidobacterium breve]|uniref:hypothetical protein n=1 Tax=Bifidobacterium breve TaxID=1685 RepID=UPI001D142070
GISVQWHSRLAVAMQCHRTSGVRAVYGGSAWEHNRQGYYGVHMPAMVRFAIAASFIIVAFA